MCGIWALLKSNPELRQVYIESFNKLKNRGPDTSILHLDKNYINIHNYDGSFVRKFEAPMQMDFSVRFYDSKTKNLFVTFYSYSISYINYKLNIETGEISPMDNLSKNIQQTVDYSD